MARIKVTGYVDSESLEPEHVAEPDDPAGPLSEEGFIELATIDGDIGMKLHNLEDLEFEWADD